jgi:hypothetical protein
VATSVLDGAEPVAVPGLAVWFADAGAGFAEFVDVRRLHDVAGLDVARRELRERAHRPLDGSGRESARGVQCRVQIELDEREVVRFALDEYGSVDAALDAFADWKGSPRRFCELAPRWGLLARRVLWAYPATQLLVEELQHMHDDGIVSPSLVDIVEYLHELHPSFTVELFVRGTEGARERALSTDGELRRRALSDGAV